MHLEIFCNDVRFGKDALMSFDDELTLSPFPFEVFIKGIAMGEKSITALLVEGSIQVGKGRGLSVSEGLRGGRALVLDLAFIPVVELLGLEPLLSVDFDELDSPCCNLLFMFNNSSNVKYKRNQYRIIC